MSSTLSLWLHYLLPESIVPASSRRLTLKQSLPPAVTIVALSLKFSSGLPHRRHTVPKECCIHNSMDVCSTSGSASPLHIAATYGAEAVLPTPPAPKSFIVTCLTEMIPLWKSFVFKRAFSSCLAYYLVFWSALPAFLSWVTVFCLRHAPDACRATGS